MPPAEHASSSQGQPKAHGWRVEVLQNIGNIPCLGAALVLEIVTDRVDGGRRSSCSVFCYNGIVDQGPIFIIDGSK